MDLNKEVIVGTAFTDAVNSGLFPGFDFNSIQSKCKRDTTFFVEAIALDIVTGGNVYSRKFTEGYFDAQGNPITNGLVGEETESIYIFNKARDYLKEAITNRLSGATYTDNTVSIGGTYYNEGADVPNNDATACQDVQDTIDTLAAIVTVNIGNGDLNNLPTEVLGAFDPSSGLSTVTPGGQKCARDIGFFVDAVSTDVFIAGNKYSQEFALQYFDASGNPISNGIQNEEVSNHCWSGSRW